MASRSRESRALYWRMDRESERLARMRQQWLDWDAPVSLDDGGKDMPQR